jgi:hypothetical protein
VDTLAVGLNVSALGADSASARILRIVGQDAYDPAVEATVAAILDNASRSEPPLTSIVLRIIGPNRYWRHAKFYPVTSAPVREFNNIPPAYRKSGR